MSRNQATFEYGEKVYCAKQVKINRTTYAPGDEFPYEALILDYALVEKLLKQRKVIRATQTTPALLKQLSKPAIAKTIRNFRGQRIVVSWPADEPIPKGTVDGRADKPAQKVEESDEEDADVADTSDDVADTSDDVTDTTAGDAAIGDSSASDPDAIGEVEVVPGSPGWYDVTVNGIVYNKTKLRKRAAASLKKQLLAG